MTRATIESYVKEQFNMDLCAFIRQKVEVESLHDYEIASVLGGNASSICKLRRACGIKRAKGFPRRFERRYGDGAVDRFKKMIENPTTSLSDVGRDFGFSREYARQVYKKIYGRPYTKFYKEKVRVKGELRLADRTRKSKQLANIMKITKKMQSMGLDYHIRRKGRLCVIGTNGYKVALRSTSTPVPVGKKQYYRINHLRQANVDFDFFICLCRDKKRPTHFIIPSGVMPKSVLSLLPEATPAQSKYAQYKEAWHLLAHTDSKHTAQIH